MKKALIALAIILGGCGVVCRAQTTGNPVPNANTAVTNPGGSGAGGGLAFVSSLPATCTPGVTPSVELSAAPYVIFYCDATNHWMNGTSVVTKVPPYTLQDIDRNTCIEPAVPGGTYTLPAIGSNGITFGYQACILNNSSGVLTVNYTNPSLIYLFGALTNQAVTTFNLQAGQAATVYSDAGANWDVIIFGSGALPAGPTTPNIPWVPCETPAGGVAGTTTWCASGVILTSQTGNFTPADVGRSGCIEANGTNLIATIPDVGGTGFTLGYNFCIFNTASTAVTVNRTSASSFNLHGSLTGVAQSTFALDAHAVASFYSSPANNWDVFVADPSIRASTTGLGYFNGNDTITSSPPVSAASNVGWKGCYYTNAYCFGVEANAEYHLINSGNNGWYGIGSGGAPAGNAAAGTPDTSFGTAMSTAGAFWAKEAVTCNGGLTNVASGYYLCADTATHEWQGVTNGAATSSSGMIARARSGAINSGNLTAAVTTATLCAATASNCDQAGQYELHFDFIETGTACGTPGTGGVTFLLTWTDANGTTHSAVSLGMDDASAINSVSQTFHFQTSLGAAWASGQFTFSSNGSIIQYATGYTACGAGTGTYRLQASVVRLQ